MLTGYLIEAIKTARALKVPLLVVALSALIALLFTVATRPAVPAVPDVAGEAQIRLMQDEHLLVADYVERSVAAEQESTRRDRAAMHETALADVPAPAVALPLPRPVKAMQVAAALPKVDSTVGPPLRLQSTVPASQPPARQRAGAVDAVVERIPRWVRAGVQDVAEWAIVGPVQTITRLPERRFL
jgi:hypothetical protein